MSETNQQETLQEQAEERSTPTFVASDTLPSSELSAGADTFEPLPNQHRLGPYELRGELGRGGMGIVYSAWDPRLDRRVAIKMLDVSSDGQRQARLLREAKAMAKLTHPNVITVHEIGEDETGHYIVMEYVAGRTLRALLDDSAAPPTRDELLRVFIDAGRGLAAIHATGLVHRDVKPDNIMIRATGQVLVMDLGIAAGELDGEGGPLLPLDTDELLAPGKLTRTGMMMGSPGYMAPEQFKLREVTPLSDQFSFCVALWEAIFGARPFQGETLRALAKAVNEGPPAPPATVDCPAWLRAVLLRGLAVEPHARAPTMSEVVEALERGRQGGTDSPRWPWLLAGAAGLAGLAALAFTSFAGEPDPAAMQRAGAEDERAQTRELPSSDASHATTDIDELVALAHTVAAVRYFHPSDAAADADWDQLTRAAILEVTRGQDAGALRRALADMVASIAPTAQIYFTDDPMPALLLEGTGPLVTWQHLGLGIGSNEYRGYTSSRTSRAAKTVTPFNIVFEAPSIETPHSKARLRIRARSEQGRTPGRAHLWFVPFGSEVSFDANAVDPQYQVRIDSYEWRDYELIIELSPDTTRLGVGATFTGERQTWFDDLELDTFDEGGEPHTLALTNGDFASLPEITPTKLGDHGWELKTVYELGPEGRNPTLRIARKLGWLPGQLFETLPSPGEAREVELGEELVLRVPIALPDSLARRRRRGSPAPPEPSPDALPDAQLDPATRSAAVILAWAALDQFWPHFELDIVDWDAALREALAQAALAQDQAGLVLVLEHMLTKLDDAFAGISGGPPDGLVPVSFARVEGKVVVVQTLPDSELLPGDELISVDGVDTETRLRELYARTSGSPQYKQSMALRSGLLARGPLGTSATLAVRRGEQRLEVTLSREFEAPTWERTGPSIEFAPDGVAYIDLCRAQWVDIEAQLPRIAAAPGVVFDLRGRPLPGSENVLGHILTERGDANWMQIPQLLYPDAPPVGYKKGGWDLPPATEPYITGSVAFLSDARTLGYGESILGFVEGYNIGDIIGATSAGNNGNRNVIELPAGLELGFTGMKVTTVSGGALQRLGIQPDLPVESTLGGVEAGRDEVLERALDHVRGELPPG